MRCTQLLFTILVLIVAVLFGVRTLTKGTCYVDKNQDLSGKVALITGGNTGIGYETAKELLQLNAHVIIACRNENRAKSAVENLKEEVPTNGGIEYMLLDLSSLASVRNFVKEWKSRAIPNLHYLINNAGLMGVPEGTKTEDGFEMHFGVNHLGHFLLTNLLLDDLKNQRDPARIINVSSRAHMRGTIDLNDLMFEKREYSRLTVYAQSKLANVVFTKELAKRLQGTHVTAFSLHPGVVVTEIHRPLNIPPALLNLFLPLAEFIMKTSSEGAQTSVYCAIQPGIEHLSGEYFSDCDVAPIRCEQEIDSALMEGLWSRSEELVGLK